MGRLKKGGGPSVACCLATVVLLGSMALGGGPRVDDPVVDVNLFAAALPSAGTAVMVGDRGGIFLSVDGGRSWRRVESGTTRALAAVCFPDPVSGWIVGQGGLLLHTEDGGKTWRPRSSGVEAYLLAVDFADPRDGMAVGADATVVVTSDGGRTWTDVSPREALGLDDDGVDLYAVAALGGGGFCAAGGRGRIFLTADGGVTWREASSPLFDETLSDGRTLYGLTVEGHVLYGVGVDGAMVRSEDGGASWVEVETGFAGPELYGIAMAGGTGFAVGAGGLVLRTTDGGSRWSLVEVPERVRGCWLSGVALRWSETGGLEGLVVGREGVFGRIRGDALSW